MCTHALVMGQIKSTTPTVLRGIYYQYLDFVYGTSIEDLHSS